MLRQGMSKEALLHFDAAIKAVSDQAGYYHNKALALSALGDNRAAIRSLEIALKLRPNLEPAEELLKNLSLSIEKRI